MNGGDRQVRLGPGGELGGYRIESSLGVGGSGTVYAARRLSDGMPVALKVMNDEHFEDDSERQRFVREAEVVKRLEHPHVVRLLDYGYAEGLPYLVFPLLEGRTLEQRIAQKGAVGWGPTGRFSEQVLSALEIAHEMGIVHRDIKPANLFLCDSPLGEIIQILDFGTAKIVGDKKLRNDVTRAGMMVGTPRYMAPEQVRMESLTPAVDVYAFGLVMAEMMLGRPIVASAAEFDIFVAQGSDKPHVLPEEIQASPFATVIARAVAKPLEVRYRLASQMLADVRGILERFGQGGAQPGEADMEATCFIGPPPEQEAPNEAAMKLRRAFNAIADKAEKAAAGESGPPAAATAPPAPPPPVIETVRPPGWSGPPKSGATVPMPAQPGFSPRASAPPLAAAGWPLPNPGAMMHGAPMAGGMVGGVGGSPAAPHAPVWQSRPSAMAFAPAAPLVATGAASHKRTGARAVLLLLTSFLVLTVLAAVAFYFRARIR